MALAHSSAPHEIAPLFGKGGGEVYRARDLKLKREVANKILPGEVSSDAGADGPHLVEMNWEVGLKT